MHIGIFETTHFEGAYPVIRLFDNGQNKITIFTYEDAYNQFKFLFGEQIDKYHWIVKENTSSKYRFMLDIYRGTKNRRIDLLYMNTVSDNHLFYALMISLLRKTRIVATLHDINGYFHFKPAFSVRRLVRFIGKRWFIRLVKEFNVVGETMVDHLKHKLPAWKKLHNLPGAVYEMTAPAVCTPPAISGRIDIVVPGTVDDRRRNYDRVFELLHACNRQNITVTVVLLGGFSAEHGQGILAACRSYATQHNNLVYYETNVVDQPEFDRVMNEAHIVFTPTLIQTVIFDGITEIYGLSICSGNLFDIIKHAKPFIAPAELRIPDYLKSGCVSYRSVDEIVSFLKDLTQGTDLYRRLTKNAEQNSLQYTIAKIRERNPTLFEAVHDA